MHVRASVYTRERVPRVHTPSCGWTRTPGGVWKKNQTVRFYNRKNKISTFTIFSKLFIWNFGGDSCPWNPLINTAMTHVDTPNVHGLLVRRKRSRAYIYCAYCSVPFVARTAYLTRTCVNAGNDDGTYIIIQYRKNITKRFFFSFSVSAIYRMAWRVDRLP